MTRDFDIEGSGKITLGPIEINFKRIKDETLDNLRGKRDKLLEQLKAVEDELKRRDGE